MASALLLGCSRGPAPSKSSPEAVAVVGGSLITIQQFEAELARRPWCVTREQRRDLVEDLIRQEVLYLRAKAAGYDRDPELRAAFRRLITARYEEDQWKTRPKPAAPTDEDVEQYYRANLGTFTAPEKVRVAVILVKAPGQATTGKRVELRKKAEAILSEARQLAGTEWSFGPVAVKYSEDQATRYAGGDCGWVSKGERHLRWEPSVVDAMFSLKFPGELSQPVPAADGFYLLKLMDRKPAEARPLEQMRERIAFQLRQEREQRQREEFDRQQRAGFRIVIRSDRLTSGSASPPLVAESRRDPPGMPAR